MQCILREKLLEHALKLAEVSNVYRTDSSKFVELYIGWLDEAEKDLSRLRAPISVVLQAEKSSLISVLDGYRPDNIQPGKSIRKSLRASAAQSIERISREFYSKIESIDSTLDQLNDKLCNAVAVLASRDPGTYDNLEANQHGIDSIWRKLGSLPETTPMYNYFCAKVTATDRNYLLLDIIQKAIGNKAGPPP